MHQGAIIVNHFRFFRDGMPSPNKKKGFKDKSENVALKVLFSVKPNPITL